MGDYRYRKLQFYTDAVQTGLVRESDLPDMGWDTPKPKLAKWLRGLTKSQHLGPNMRLDRLVNHFTLGADPEFVFTNSGGEPVHANAMSFRTARAYGADQNGRLVEIRPYAYRSMLRVLGSIHATLRWMCLTMPNVANLNMIAGAFQFRDGLGGHVHVGRKKLAKFHAEYTKSHGLTPEDVRGLDNICTGLIELGVFPKNECLLRRAGDARGQIYGALGDIRLQRHGYEYRSFPSWLDNPWLTYFVLVLSKLVVFDPFLLGQEILSNSEKSRNRIVNFLAYYKGIDDDAALAHSFLMRHGFPRHMGGDFRSRWGLVGYEGKDLRKTVQYVPSAIKAPNAGLKELWEYFTKDKPIRKGVIPEPTWSPVAPPEGYEMCLDKIDTTGQKGIGETLCDVAQFKKNPILVRASSNGGMLLVSQNIVKHLRTDWIEYLAEFSKLPRSYFNTDTRTNDFVQVSPAYREGVNLAILRKVLISSGVFPLWKITEIAPESFARWRDKQANVAPKRPALRANLQGVLIGEVVGTTA